MAFQQALSGLNVAAKAIDSTSHNIANSSTVGYKSSVAHFSDVYAASLTGTGASQVGIGVNLAAIQQQFTQGNITSTNNPLDISINGGGFFRMDNNGATTFARNGQFHLDKSGFIINDQGMRLTGYAAQSGIITPTTPEALQISASDLAPVATGIYMADDPWIAMATMTAVILMAVGLRGFLGRIAIFLGLLFGYLLCAFIDLVDDGSDRVTWAAVMSSSWFGFPDKTVDGLTGNQFEADNIAAVGWHWPSFSITFALLVLPAVIALVAENVGHVKAVSGMTGEDLDPVMGRAIAADGVGTVIATTVGGSPTTTYAENIGVMAATRVYSTAPYFVAAIVAILLGLVPKFGAVINATPLAVLGGITIVLYGMIGLLGAKIWKENGVDFAKPVNLVPVAAGIILAIGNADLKLTDDFHLTGIALGTVVVVLGYHLARLVAPAGEDDGTMLVVGKAGTNVEDHAAPHDHKH